MSKRTAVVLAGGLGTRLQSVTGGLIPKALVPVRGVPFLDYKLTSLIEMGVQRIVLLIGEKGDLIREYVEDRWTDRLEISCVADGPNLLGTAGAIASSRRLLPDSFWVTYADSYVMANLEEAEDYAIAKGFSGVLTVWHNSDSLELSNTTIYNGRVLSYTKVTQPGQHEWIDYGLLYLPRDSFDSIDLNAQTDLGEVVRELIELRQLGAWEVTDRFWDVGTPETLHLTEVEFGVRPRKCL